MINICIIGVYFGKFQNYFPLWLKSCEWNKTIDFFIVTDNDLVNVPQNVKVIKLNLRQLKKLIEYKLNIKISLETPYKCCDFKPVYGIIFEDYISKYDFWGHCDLDLIFGDIRLFLEKYKIEKYDKFLPLGHLSFYRNTYECNNRYKLESKSGNTYNKSFITPHTTQFDELAGINAIYKEYSFPFFRKRIFVDVSIKWERIKLAEDYIDPYDNLNNSKDKNYKYQLFSWKEGKILRYYVNRKEILCDEFMYIHIKKRKFDNLEGNILNSNVFLITPHKFVSISDNNEISIKLIKSMNPYYGYIYEFFEGTILKKLKAKIKRILIKAKK